MAPQLIGLFINARLMKDAGLSSKCVGFAIGKLTTCAEDLGFEENCCSQFCYGSLISAMQDNEVCDCVCMRGGGG